MICWFLLCDDRVFCDFHDQQYGINNVSMNVQDIKQSVLLKWHSKLLLGSENKSKTTKIRGGKFK